MFDDLQGGAVTDGILPSSSAVTGDGVNGDDGGASLTPWVIAQCGAGRGVGGGW